MHLHLAPEEHHHHPRHGSSPARFWWAATVLFVLGLATVLLLRTVFFVDETEYVYVTQFGEPIRLYTSAGLGLKWPYQSLRRFDRRLQMYEPPGREMLTEDKENLTFQWYVCWRIPGESFAREHLQAAATDSADELSPQRVQEEIEHYVRRFLQSVGTNAAAERRLEERIQAAMAAEIGRTQLQQLVSLTPEELQLEAVAARVTDSLREAAAEQFGIEVVDVRLKRFNYPEAVKPSVYAEIRSERERVAIQYRAEGASQKSKIESLADLQRQQLLSQAQREATRIRGEAEARAIEIYNAAHSKDPEFYELLKTLETYRTILDDQTTVVLSADSPLLRLLTRGLPDITETPAKLPSEEPADRPEEGPPTAGSPAPSSEIGVAGAETSGVPDRTENRTGETTIPRVAEQGDEP
jgi:membrane protease subunit HflC